MTETPADKPVADADLRPPVLPLLLELDKVRDALRSLLPDFDVDRITAITITPSDAVVSWWPIGTREAITTTLPVLNAASVAELNGKAPE